MSLKKGLVLDYKILLQAVLPGQVLPLLEKYESTVDFRSPDVCFLTVRRTLTQTLERKGANTTEARDALARLEQIVGPIDVALLFDSPIWTHDEEFLGAGIASWRTTTVELYLK
jgi:hypothetical protein